jgi:hypothetical protein
MMALRLRIAEERLNALRMPLLAILVKSAGQLYPPNGGTVVVEMGENAR